MACFPLDWCPIAWGRLDLPPAGIGLEDRCADLNFEGLLEVMVTQKTPQDKGKRSGSENRSARKPSGADDWSLGHG